MFHLLYLKMPLFALVSLFNSFLLVASFGIIKKPFLLVSYVITIPHMCHFHSLGSIGVLGPLGFLKRDQSGIRLTGFLQGQETGAPSKDTWYQGQAHYITVTLKTTWRRVFKDLI